MSEADPAQADAPGIQVLSAILHDIGASERITKFIEDDHDDQSIIALSFTKPHKISKKYGLSPEQATSFVERCCIALDTEELAAALEFVDKCRTSLAAQEHSTAACIAALNRLKFDVMSELGKGAFGVVYKCKSRLDKRTVAVKFVLDSKNCKEAMREGQRLEKCRHPNIVSMYKVHDLGNGRCALEMEVVPGGDLSQHLEAGRRRPEFRLPRNAVIQFTRQLLNALHYLHAKSQMSFLHGDIKPQNILVACDPPPVGDLLDSPIDSHTHAHTKTHIDYTSAEIKLADFGLAKTMATSTNAAVSFMVTNASTVAGVIKGTMWYMSPEALQGAARGRERCFADDLWSACLVIFEMDTGLTVQELMTAPGAVSINVLLTKTSAQLLPLLCSVLASDAASRCSSAAELLQILSASEDPLFEWQYFETLTQTFTSVPAAAAFVLEKSFAANQPHASLSLQPPLDLNFDVRPLVKSAESLGMQSQRSTGISQPIRRMLKSSVLTSGASIPVWQELIDAMEWRQCDPSTCARLELDLQKSSAGPDPSSYRRVILQTGSIDRAQIPCPLKSEPYLEPAQAADVAVMTARVHASLPEWDISEMLQIVNPALQSKYADYRHRVAARCNGNPNERMLFHFAPELIVPKIWQEGEGHDPRLSVWAEVGKGAYFSEHLMYGYAYNFKLWPSASSGWIAEPEPECGATMRVFATLVTLGHVADMGPGCETCPSDVWNAWKQEFAYSKSAENPSPKPTRPPVMPLPSDAAHKQHLLDCMQVKDAPRFDSIVSTEGDLATHPSSTNRAPSGQCMSAIMHPRLKQCARKWGQQYVVFETAASYPVFLITLKKTRESPIIYVHGSDMQGSSSVEEFSSIPQLLTKPLLASTFSRITNLFISNCPGISASTITDVLQLLKAEAIQCLTLRNAGVDDTVLEFCFGSFRSLESLDVGENLSLVNIHPSISALTSLKNLGVAKCSNIQSFPDELLELRASLKVINACHCPSLCFPPKFIAQQGCEVIFQFLQDAQKSKPLRRVKIVFMGDYSSGQASFLHALAKIPAKEHSFPIDFEDRLKSGFESGSFLQNLPEFSYFNISKHTGQDDLDLSALFSFRRQTVFVIIFSVTEDTELQMRQVCGWMRTIASNRVSRQHVRFVVLGTKVDLIPGSLCEVKRKLDDIAAHLRGAITKDFYDLVAENEIKIMFVTSQSDHPEYDNRRRDFKRHVFLLSKSIFEGVHCRQLRFPDCYKPSFDSVDALKKKLRLGHPRWFHLQSISGNLQLQELDGSHQDPLKSDALKMLHEIGEIAVDEADGANSTRICVNWAGLLAPALHNAVLLPDPMHPPIEVRLVHYTPKWPLEFQRERQRLMGIGCFDDVLHVGSTSVPGAMAKPYIDMVCRVDPALSPYGTAVMPWVEPLNRQGYRLYGRKSIEHNEYNFGMYYYRPSESRECRGYFLHFQTGKMLPGSLTHFAELLQSDASLVEEYNKVKQRIVADHPRISFVEYTMLKTAFIMSAKVFKSHDWERAASPMYELIHFITSTAAGNAPSTQPLPFAPNDVLFLNEAAYAAGSYLQSFTPLGLALILAIEPRLSFLQYYFSLSPHDHVSVRNTSSCEFLVLPVDSFPSEIERMTRLARFAPIIRRLRQHGCTVASFMSSTDWPSPIIDAANAGGAAFGGIMPVGDRTKADTKKTVTLETLEFLAGLSKPANDGRYYSDNGQFVSVIFLPELRNFGPSATALWNGDLR